MTGYCCLTTDCVLQLSPVAVSCAGPPGEGTQNQQLERAAKAVGHRTRPDRATDITEKNDNDKTG